MFRHCTTIDYSTFLKMQPYLVAEVIPLLFYVCSLLEYIGRLCKIERSKLVNQQPRCRASGYVVLIRWLQSVLIPFVTTQSVRVLKPPHESTWKKQYKKTL